VKSDYTDTADVLCKQFESVFVKKTAVESFESVESDWIRSSIKMFADDTKLWTTISVRNHNQKLQGDLRNLKDWSDKWLTGY